MRKFCNNSADFLIACVVYLGAVLLIPIWADFPLNDDWVYARDVLETCSRGRFWITGFEYAWAIPQIAAGVLVTSVFGFSHICLRGIGIISLVGVLLFSSLLLKETGLSWRTRTIVLLSLAFFPPMFIASLSFMTDLPFLLFWVGTFYFWEKALQNESPSFLLAGCLFCLLAVLQRQTGVFLILAMLFAVWRNPGWKDARLMHVRILSIACLVIILAFIMTTALWSHLGGQEMSIQIMTGAYLNAEQITFFITLTIILAKVLMILFALIYLGLFFLPLSFFACSSSESSGKTISMGRLRIDRKTVSDFIILFALSVLLGFSGLYMPYFDNLLSKWGVFGINEVLPGARTPIFGPFPGFLLTWICMASTVILMSVFRSAIKITEGGMMKTIWKHLTTWRKPGIGFFIFIACAIYFSVIAIKGIRFDRYLLPFLPVIIISLRKDYFHYSNLRTTLSLVSLALICLVSFSISYDYFSWNNAKWSLAVEATKRYTTADQVDGGYEWMGWHENKNREPEKWNTYPYIISFSPASGYQVAGMREFKTILSKDKKIYLLKKDKPDI